jgi:hypothetical protein
MRLQVGQTDDPALPHDESEDTLALRGWAQMGPGGLVDARGHEGVELAMVFGKDPDGRVTGPDNLAGELRDPLQHTFEGELGGQEQAGGDQLLEPFGGGGRRGRGTAHGGK